MEKRIRFSEQPLTSKIIYGVVIAILIFSAVIVGIVAANNRKTNTPEPPPVENNGENENTPTPDNSQNEQKEPVKDKLTFAPPMSGEIVASHSLSVPVFSETLGEWRVHTGIDISAEEGDEVFCSADGEVSRIYHDPLHGMTVEVKHEGDILTIYANLDEMVANGLTVGKEIKKGEKIGVVGDTSLVELGKEPHLHFVIRLKGVAVNPLDYFEKAEETK